MRGCRRLSKSEPEPDGFHDLLTGNEQDMFDLAAAREARREKQGYVSLRCSIMVIRRRIRSFPPGHSVVTIF